VLSSATTHRLAITAEAPLRQDTQAFYLDTLTVLKPGGLVAISA
jgi:hypothetical protein